MKKKDLMRACPSLCSGRSTPPFPPIRRDIGRFVPQKAVPSLPLLTLEGCPKDGVVSAPSVVLTLTTETGSDTLPLISCFF